MSDEQYQVQDGVLFRVGDRVCEHGRKHRPLTIRRFGTSCAVVVLDCGAHSSADLSDLTHIVFVTGDRVFIRIGALAGRRCTVVDAHNGCVWIDIDSTREHIPVNADFIAHLGPHEQAAVSTSAAYDVQNITFGGYFLRGIKGDARANHLVDLANPDTVIGMVRRTEHMAQFHENGRLDKQQDDDPGSRFLAISQDHASSHACMYDAVSALKKRWGTRTKTGGGR